MCVEVSRRYSASFNLPFCNCNFTRAADVSVAAVADVVDAVEARVDSIWAISCKGE